jgi:NADP-dependent 3-hydroxy acid dehydrogenase YdfG
VLLARNPDSFESLAKEINSSGGKALGISTDISDSNSIQQAVESIQREFGQDVGAAVRLI